MSGKEKYNEYLDILTEIYNREAVYRTIDLEAAEDILNELSIQTAEDLSPALQYLDPSPQQPYLISDFVNAISSHLGTYPEEIFSSDVYSGNAKSSSRKKTVSDSSKEESLNGSMLDKSARKKTNRSHVSNLSSSVHEESLKSGAQEEINTEFDLMSELLNLSKASISKKEAMSEIPIRTARKEDLKEFTNRLMHIEKDLLELFRTTSYYDTLDYVIRNLNLSVSDVGYDSFRKYIIDSFKKSFPHTPLPTESSDKGTKNGNKLQTSEKVKIRNKQGEQETWEIKDEMEDKKEDQTSILKTFIEIERQGNLSYMNYFESLQEWFVHEDVHMLQLDMLPDPTLELSNEKPQESDNPPQEPNNPPQDSVQQSKEQEIIAKLIQTIKEYEELRLQRQQTGEETTVIDSLISTLREQLAKIQSGKISKPSKPKQKEAPIEEKSKDPLKEIFEFYAKQQNNAVKSALIEQLVQNYSTLNLAKFMRFMKEFELMDTIKRKDKRMLDSNISKTIFKKNATHAKDMNYEQFIQALDMVAILYFDAEYDKLYNTDYKSLPLPEKRTKLFTLLGCDNPENYRSKLKGFSIAFSTNTEYRVPENDPAKNYKYKPYKHQRMALEDWKKQKQQHMQQIQPPKPPKPKKQSETQSPQIKPSETPSQSKDFEKPDSYLKMKNLKQHRNPFTWQGLGEMNPEQLKDAEDDFDIKNLIVDDESDEDEYLNKQYPLAHIPEPLVPASKPDPAKYEATPKNSYKSSLSNSRNFSPGNAVLKGNNSISRQALERAQELNESQKKTQDDQLKRIMKIADAQIAKAKKMTDKLNKYKS